MLAFAADTSKNEIARQHAAQARDADLEIRDLIAVDICLDDSAGEAHLATTAVERLTMKWNTSFPGLRLVSASIVDVAMTAPRLNPDTTHQAAAADRRITL
jgi:hypothetical protein